MLNLKEIILSHETHTICVQAFVYYLAAFACLNFTFPPTRNFYHQTCNFIRWIPQSSLTSDKLV